MAPGGGPGPKKYWLGPGPPQRRKVARFQGPREVPGGSGEGSGEVFLVFSVARRGGAKNSPNARKKHKFAYLLHACCLEAFLCYLASFSRRRRESGP